MPEAPHGEYVLAPSPRRCTCHSNHTSDTRERQMMPAEPPTAQPHKELPLWATQLAVFDTETTGVDIHTARVVSSTIALIGAQGEVLERYDWLLNPGIPIPQAASQVHGITTEVAQASGVAAAVGISQILARLREMLDRGFPIVAYNAPYDLSLLRAEAHRYSLDWPSAFAPVIDPLVIDKQCDRFRRGKRTLEVVAAHYGIQLHEAHDAGEDAIAAGRLAQALARRYAQQLPSELMELHRAQVEWSDAQAANFESYMRRERDQHFTAERGWPLREPK